MNLLRFSKWNLLRAIKLSYNKKMNLIRLLQAVFDFSAFSKKRLRHLKFWF